jgi:predicted CXXCH cytochrome family protein
MKKILVALALAAFASSSFAAVENSAHDFDFGGTYGTGLASRCMYCHVPHAAQTWGAGTALWALPDPGLSLTLYSNAKYQPTDVDARGTMTCLTCHADGTTAQTGLAVTVVGTAADLTTDLSNDHPVGNTVIFNPGGSGMKPSPIILGFTTYTNGGNYEMECATCHNPHNSRTIPGRKLLSASTAAAGTDFCNFCHTR